MGEAGWFGTHTFDEKKSVAGAGECDQTTRPPQTRLTSNHLASLFSGVSGDRADGFARTEWYRGQITIYRSVELSYLLYVTKKEYRTTDQLHNENLFSF